MSEARDRSAYTTADLRKYLGDALGKAHFQKEVVNISHHGRPYAAVISDEDAKLLTNMKSLEPPTDFREQLAEAAASGRSFKEFVNALVTATQDGQPPRQTSGSKRRTG